MQTHTHDRYTTSPVRLRILTLADFGETLLAIKQGLRMRRSHWPKGMYLALAVPEDKQPYIYLTTGEGAAHEWWWGAQEDLLASDWRTL